MKPLLLFLLFPSLLFAQQLPIPQAPSIAAKSYLLTDFYSKQVLVGQNINERIEPASLTKLMTAYLTFTALKQKQITLEQMLPISTRAWRAEGSRMFIDPRLRVGVEDLVLGQPIRPHHRFVLLHASVLSADSPSILEPPSTTDLQRLACPASGS